MKLTFLEMLYYTSMTIELSDAKFGTNLDLYHIITNHSYVLKILDVFSDEIDNLNDYKGVNKIYN